ncbi:MAG TPA: hypothetical protein VG095_03615 [Chthoniobacterales bacterium]|nr:hypothetical protein [Chthoniobacterales bacterium]
MRHGCLRGSTIFFQAVVLGVALSASRVTHAQTSPTQAVDRAQLLRTQPTLRDDEAEEEATGTDDTHAIATPNDPDLGEQAILKRSDRYRPFTVVVSAPIAWTSNVALTRTNEQDDVIFTPNAAFIFAPRIAKTVFATFSVSQQQFYYGEFDELDFGSFDGRAGVSYTVPTLHNLLLRAEYDYNRLTSGNGFDAFFENHALILGAEVPFEFGRAQQLSAGVDINVSLHADPNEPQRHDFGAFVSYSANLTRAFTANAVARVAYREYENVDRSDVSGIFSLGATYRFTKWLSANAISSFAISDSDVDVFDYEVANIGGAASLTFRF